MAPAQAALKASVIMPTDETAEVLGVSPITVKSHWRMTKAWLYGQLANNNE